MHSQCFLVLHQSKVCELVKLWAASGTFPVVDRQGAQQRLHWAACRDSHFISWSAHRHTQRAPFHRKSCYHFSDTPTQRKHWHWTSYQRPRNRSCSTDGLTPSIQSLTDENKWDLLCCFHCFHLIWVSTQEVSWFCSSWDRIKPHLESCCLRTLFARTCSSTMWWVGELPTVVRRCVQVLMLTQAVQFPSHNFYI